MNKLFVLKLALTGLYYVEGKGFVGNLAQATRLDQDSSNCTSTCATKMGFSGITSEEVKTGSFAIVYIRATDTFTGGQLVKAPLNTTLNQFDPSRRRFGTFEEARIHGSRFHTRRARRTDPINSGTAGHRGFFIVESTDPVNSAVNPVSGLTNRL